MTLFHALCDVALAYAGGLLGVVLLLAAAAVRERLADRDDREVEITVHSDSKSHRWRRD
jgi:hypothetical protein